MLLEQQSSSASPASTLVRGNSEPPEGGGGVNFNEINGLRRSRNPIKVAGITMGSQENVNDELAAVFATRRRRRRSATPVKIGGIVMGDGEEIEESQNSLPFGGNKRNSYHPGSSVTKRNTNLGMWGQRIFTNGHQNHENEAEKEDVKQFLTDMHSEIKAMTVNLNDIESDELPNLVSVEETIVIGKPEEMIEIQPDQVKYHTGQTPHPNRVDPKFKVMSDAEDEDFELIEINPEEVRIHDSAPQKQLLVPTKPRHESKSPSPHLAIISDFITAKMIQDEKKNTTVKESIETSEKKVCSETAVVTCVQVEQAAASSLIEESTQRSNYSNSMENTSKISQVTQEQVSMEKSSFQETSSEIINQIEAKTETSQNFEVKIENFETSQKIESQKIENFSQNLTNINQIEIKTETTEQIENFETTQQFENFETSQKIENFSQELANVNQIENSDYVMDKSETKKMEELFDKLVAEEATKMTKPVKSRSFDAIEKWLMNSHENQLQKVEIKEETSKETSKETKLQNKRNRNRTIDFSSLPNNADYYQSTATCVTKTYEAPKLVAQISTESEPDTSASSGLSGRKPGLCLIIDKLKSIETKLDELKTYDALNAEETNHENDSDDTLKDDLEKTEVNSQATDVSHTTELFVDDENIVISSPIATPILNKSLSKVKNNVDIMSIHTMSEVDDADDEEDEEDISSGRQSRIEMLAKKIMEEEAKIQNLNCQAKRDPINLNAELDTVSERSEIEDDSLVESIKHDINHSGRRSADHLQPEKGSFRGRRTRSASRERNLTKIRFCWRCHQSGHESFDCTAELQPANWCPRCLETSHWEDNCWVNEQEVFCNICALPGHLPCVHQTNDFRQRKLVIETFGWLAFKDWFREPEFWSWWNCSGFTNVPLYKLMQHRPHVASPTDLQEITE